MRDRRLLLARTVIRITLALAGGWANADPVPIPVPIPITTPTDLPITNPDANTASRADLEAIRGIGPGLAARILESRRSGEFTSWADLLRRVPGLGRRSAARLSGAGLTVNGRGYAAPPEAEAASAHPEP